MTKLTVKEMTARYNVAAAELGRPIVKKLKPTKEFDTVEARYDAMVALLDEATHETIDDVIASNEKRIRKASEKPITVPTVPPHRANRKPLNPAAETKRVEKATEVALEKNRDNAKAAMKAAAPAGIKSTRAGTSIHLLIECVIAGGTVAELHNMMDGIWTENSIRAALAWDIPKKGYKVDSRMTTVDGKDMLFYRISNSKVVV